MLTEIGHVEAILRHPVKSMGGEQLEVATLGWHGLDGDRRLALRRTDDRSAFPWLTAGKLPGLLLFTPSGGGEGGEKDRPTHVRSRTARRCLCSGRTWRPRSDVATERP